MSSRRTRRKSEAARGLVALVVIAALAWAGATSCTGGPRSATDEEAGKGGATARDGEKREAPREEAASREVPSPAAARESAARSTSSPASPATSGLRAGFADDNRQFNYFVRFLAQYGPGVEHFPLAVSERIVVRVRDAQEKPVANAAVAVFDGGDLLVRGVTYGDGSFLFFPALYGETRRTYRVVVSAAGRREELEIRRDGPRRVEIRMPEPRVVPEHIPLDILFILDTTGSMGEEIARLKRTIELIYMNLSAISIQPAVRFGLVLYKDITDDFGDGYRTRVVDLTGDLETFRLRLAEVYADGGGDTPEDLQAALDDAMHKVHWNDDGLRLAFVITDAPPHLDYEDEQYTYVEAAREAKERGIKIFGVGTGGLDLAGEYVLRQIAQFTYAKYIFLTYGESGESEGGRTGSVSHHTGANYQTDKLEAIIIRFAREELSWQSDRPLEPEEEYFQAVRVSDEQKSETLAKLFDMAVSQLVDYSSIRIADGTPIAVLPIVPSGGEQAPATAQAEYFTQQLALSVTRSGRFHLVEREDLQKVLQELELQLSGLADDKEAARVGKLLGAKLLLDGRLYRRQEEFELFLKLLRVETGEVLSVTKARVDRGLGL